MISARRAALLGLTEPLSAVMTAVLGLWPEAESGGAESARAWLLPALSRRAVVVPAQRAMLAGQRARAACLSPRVRAWSVPPLRRNAMPVAMQTVGHLVPLARLARNGPPRHEVLVPQRARSVWVPARPRIFNPVPLRRAALADND